MFFLAARNVYFGSLRGKSRYVLRPRGYRPPGQVLSEFRETLTTRPKLPIAQVKLRGRDEESGFSTCAGWHKYAVMPFFLASGTYIKMFLSHFLALFLLIFYFILLLLTDLLRTQTVLVSAVSLSKCL